MSAARLPVTVLAGFDQHAVADVGAGLLVRGERLASIWADPFTAGLGFVQTTVCDSDGRADTYTVELQHGCLSCAMRESVADALRRIAASGSYDAVLVRLHPGIEVDAAVEALAAQVGDVAVIDTIVAVLDMATWFADLSGGQSALQRGIAVEPDDHRSAAMILASSLDCANVVVLAAEGGLMVAVGECQPAPYAGLDDLSINALSVLAPSARSLVPPTMLDVPPRWVIRTGAHDARRLDVLSDSGLRSREHVTEGPVGPSALRVVRWRSDRPLHPGRLHAALDQLADGMVRSTGHLWLASRPGAIIRWESAGDALSLGECGDWADAPTAAPGSSLAFLGDGLERNALTRALDSCLLTDDEMRRGPRSWAAMPDPFLEWVDDTGEADQGLGAA